MTPLLMLYDTATDRLYRFSAALLPTTARLVFAAVLLGYFWASAMTKFAGPITPSTGAYAQIFPRAFEAVGYDASQLGLWQKLVVLAGSYGEVILPLLVVIGLFTRLAALGMIGFIIVQSLTDIFGHQADASTVGIWFDRVSDSLILDQRALWMLPLIVLLSLGGGPISGDAILLRLRKK